LKLSGWKYPQGTYTPLWGVNIPANTGTR